MKSLAYLALIATAGLSVAVHAEDAKKDKNDPDRLICRSEQETGSRLSKNKRCMTKAQWDEDRRLTRMQLEQNQAGRYKNN